jgi:hypothetical protein
MQSDRLLVLLANRDGAVLCENRDGISDALKHFAAPQPAGDCSDPVICPAEARWLYRRWARELMAELSIEALDDCGGIVLGASRDLMKELLLAMDRTVFDLVIAQFHDVPEVTCSRQNIATERALRSAAQ